MEIDYTHKLKKKSTLIMLILLIIIIVVLVLFQLFTSTKGANKEVIIKEVVEKESKIEVSKNENIVIFGDSITEIYPAEDIYGNLPIVNSGVSGYKTQDLLNNMEKMLYQYNPSKVILLIGTNDVLYDTSKETQDKAIQNIQTIIEQIHDNRPKAKIYIESIYPVNKSLDTTFDFQSNNEVIKGMNVQIKQICEEENLTYINMYDELTDENGNLDSKYTYDGLHPNTLGYAKITRALLPYIYE